MPELSHVDDVLDVYFWSLIESIWTIILFTINYYYYSCDSFISLLTPAWAVVCGSLNYAYTQKTHSYSTLAFICTTLQQHNPTHADARRAHVVSYDQIL